LAVWGIDAHTNERRVEPRKPGLASKWHHLLTRCVGEILIWWTGRGMKGIIGSDNKILTVDGSTVLVSFYMFFLRLCTFRLVDVCPHAPSQQFVSNWPTKYMVQYCVLHLLKQLKLQVVAY
jgi:hypothetical protein